MHPFYVYTIKRSGALGRPVRVDVDGVRLSADEVVRAGKYEEVLPRPKLTYSVSLCIPTGVRDIAVVWECSTRGEQIPKQIWIFSELEDELVTQGDVEEVIQILKQEYAANPLSLYFD